jgi:hypothetical protein
VDVVSVRLRIVDELNTLGGGNTDTVSPPETVELSFATLFDVPGTYVLLIQAYGDELGINRRYETNADGSVTAEIGGVRSGSHGAAELHADLLPKPVTRDSRMASLRSFRVSMIAESSSEISIH